MAFTTPKTIGPDGIAREVTVFSTTQGTRFFSGEMGSDTVDMEISIRGGAFTSDPDIILFEGTSWTMPNPAAFPDGLDLVAGLNRIAVRALSSAGTESTPATLDVTLVQERDINVVAEPPTNISVTRRNNAIAVKAEAPPSTTLQGLNFYASQYEGGGATGYSRINLHLVDTGVIEEDTAVISTTEVVSPIASTLVGAHAADPLFIRTTQQQEDSAGTILQTDFSETFEVFETVNKVKTSTTVSSVREVTFFSFLHDRAAGPTYSPATVSNGSFAALPNTDPLYYVITAVYYDAERLLEIESSFSQEVVGSPVQVTATLGNFPVVTRQRIAQSTIESIFRSNPQVRVDPGAPLRELYIDPFTSEAERLRFLVDFLYRSSSFATLLQVDDPENTGTSIAVSQSSYKQALKASFFLTRDTDVQSIIDRAFEVLASNVGVFRRPGTFARGEVTFFTTRRPTSTLTIPLGSLISGGSRDFRTSTPSSIPLARLASFYDPVSKRYLVRVAVQATAVGSAGNVGKGQVRSTNLPGLSVINEAEMFGGKDQDTNKQLAERAQNALAAVDTGTRQGYLQTAADVAGVVQANVVDAGHTLMQRDIDAAGVHRGGKVDIWVQGENLATVTDAFAFTFEIAQDVHFEVIGNPADYIFRAVDPALSEGNPIVEMLDFPAVGFEFRNATTGQVFDLTNVVIQSFDTIQLSTAVGQPTVTLSDVVLGDYRRRAGTTFTFSRQPVQAVASVTGAISGSLGLDLFALNHPQSPLENGRSFLAGDYLTINATTDVTTGVTIPSGDTIQISNEPHVLIGEFQEFVDNLGANFLTLVVTDSTGTTTYKGPNDPSGLSDYTILTGGQTTALSIKRTSSSTIASGETILISYEHDENFQVEYTTNLVVSTVQNAVDLQRHATADVLAKEVITVPVDITATIVLNRGAQVSDADTALRTNLENFFAALRLGDPMRQSDIIEILDRTVGVAFVVVPLAKLARGEGSTVVREGLATNQAGDTTFLTSLSTSLVSVFLVGEELSAATTTGGGPSSDFRGVFEDDVEMTLSTTDVNLLSLGVHRAFIVGSGGISLEGFSDDTTLINEGYVTAASRQARREALTANRILISLAVGDSPTSHIYGVTYIVGADTGSKNILPSDAEVLTLGETTFTYDEAR